MAEFPQVLTALMKLEELTQAELERASGIDRTTISRFQRGDRLPDRAQLGQLLVGISGDRARQLELLMAHLRDEAAAAIVAGITPSHYVIKPADEDMPGTAGTLSAELDLLRSEAAQHDDVRDIIVELARMIRRHQAELMPKLAMVYPISGDSPTPAVADSATTAPVSRNLEQAKGEEHHHIGKVFEEVQQEKDAVGPVPPSAPKPRAPRRPVPAKGGAKAGE